MSCITNILLSSTEFTSCGDVGVDMNELLTTEVSAMTSVKEFNRIVNSELVDVKNRKTISGYPILRALYERYKNESGFQDNPISSGFDYYDVINFTELVGTYWVDLIEQVVPSTTIWGSTYIYGNTVFDQQKFKYKKYSILGCQLPIYQEKLPSPTSAFTTNVEMTTETLPNDKYDNVSGSTTGTTFAAVTYNGCSNTSITTSGNTTCTGVGILQINCGSEFIGNLSIMGNTGTTIGSGTINVSPNFTTFNAI